MRAVTLTSGRLAVEHVAPPQAGDGQLLLDVRRCGICGSDLHARSHGDDLADVLQLAGYPRYMRSSERVVLGHEVLGVVADHGPGTRRPGTRGALAPGTPVVAIPLVRRNGQVDGIGLSAAASGGYAEQVVVQEALTMAVPQGTPPEAAVLTEPLAVAWHAVEKGQVRRRDVAVVIGAGPVGLAVIAVLAARGVRTIVASDPSPARRDLAVRCGATDVVDPGSSDPFDSTPSAGHVRAMTDATGAGIDAMTRLRTLPVPWWHAWRALDAAGLTRLAAPVVFECVGAPGMIDSLLGGAPLGSRIVVVGVCMPPDRIRPALAVNKEIELRFVVGYSPLEFRRSLHALATGRVDLTPLVTGHVGLDGVDAAFTALADPAQHAKILIDPAIRSEDIHR